MRTRMLRRWSPLAAGVAVAVTGLALSGLSPVAAGSGDDDGPEHHGHHHDHGHEHHAGHRLDHVFIIMLENHSKGDVIGDEDMPYTTSLAHRYAEATNFYGVTHPSEPNYIAATSGSTWWTNDDDGWLSGNDFPVDTATGGNHYPHRNIVDQLEENHIPWAAYMESMPRAGYLPDDWPEEASGLDPLYESKHNPFILYNDVRFSSERRSQIKPYDVMARDLNSRHAPRYVWITPNLCNDLHGGVYSEIDGWPHTPCPYGDAINQDEPENDLQHYADAFVKQAVHTITHSRAWTGRSVIFVTTDENDFDESNEETGQWETAEGCCDSPHLPAGDPYVSPEWPGGEYGGGLSPFIAITKHGPRGITDDTAYNHYSMLRTIEEGFGLPYLGYASDSVQVKSMWPLLTRHDDDD